METLAELFENPLWEILQFAVIFVAKPLWDFLTTSGAVTVRLEMNPAQNSLLNYVITNTGGRSVRDVKIAFSRAPRARGELWTAEDGVSELTFRSLSPGERHVSMFAPGAAKVEPIGVVATYSNGPFFPRLGRHVLPARCRLRRRTSTVLDMSEFLNFRYNTGFAGKGELGEIVEAIKDLKGAQQPAKKALIEETTPVTASWVQRTPVGKVSDQAAAG